MDGSGGGVSSGGVDGSGDGVDGSGDDVNGGGDDVDGWWWWVYAVVGIRGLGGAVDGQVVVVIERRM